MSLAGILSTVADDPRLSRALDIGRAQTRAPEPGASTPGTFRVQLAPIVAGRCARLNN